ncbi:MAG: FAD-binding oxidoreductase [Acidimicrobiales bacterium]
MTAAAEMRRRPFGSAVVALGGELAGDDPVEIVGGATASTIGGPVDPGARPVVAPAGLLRVDAEEQTVRVLAGTPVAELTSALAEVGQEVAISRRPGGTVGGALAVGAGRLDRPRVGPARDALLEADVVTADGRLVRCGGPTVKNVTGFDLCRLLVGSLGTVAVLGEVLLRTRPLPAASVWFTGPGLPSRDAGVELEPSARLWDGTTGWVLLAGHPDDVEHGAGRLEQRGWVPTEGPPPLPPHRWAVDPGAVHQVIADAGCRVVAEVGVGTVHHGSAPPARTIDPVVRSLNRRMRTHFDPSGRLNPGRDVLAP